MSTTVKKIWNIFSGILVAIIVILAILMAGVRLFGLTPFVVISGSMEPTYPTGSLIYVRQVPPEDIQVGDPITFILNKDLVIATHRVVEINAESQSFITKGDANESVDSAPVHFNNLVGKPVFCIPYLGYLSDFMTQKPTMYIGFAIIAVLLLLMFAPDLLRAAEKSDEKSKEKRRGAQENEGESQEASNILPGTHQIEEEKKGETKA